MSSNSLPRSLVVAGTAASAGVLLGLLILKTNTNARKRFFSSLLHKLTSKESPTLSLVRSELLQGATGIVVEIGPGTGINLRHLKTNTEVKQWIGVEPNEHMHPYLNDTFTKLDLPFSTKVCKGVGEDLSFIDSDSVDTVILTHVLCSVSDTAKVLEECTRILRPGGKILFLEHVLAGEHETLTRWTQKALLPVWKIIGDGCDFKPTWTDIDNLQQAGRFQSLSYRKFEADIALRLARPHICGTAQLKE